MALTNVSREFIDVFKFVSSATEDEMESCYPCVSILSGAVRARCVDTPGAESLALLGITKPTEQVKLDAKLAIPENLRDAMLAAAFLGSAGAVDECLVQGADLSMQ